MAQVTFILGGTRCGKSSYAEQLAINNGKKKFYIATAEVLDAEMRERIELHRRRRGNDWITLEIPLGLAEGIGSFADSEAVILVDCLTLWVSNLLHHELDVNEQIGRLVESLKRPVADIILVSNEVGLGIVPENMLARAFRDYAGILHQEVAAIADRVVWMVAGIPTVIKGSHD